MPPHNHQQTRTRLGVYSVVAISLAAAGSTAGVTSLAVGGPDTRWVIHTGFVVGDVGLAVAVFYGWRYWRAGKVARR